jgi:hypothetical protein
MQIDDDLLAMLGQTAHTHLQKGVLDRLMVGADFMTTGIFIVTKLKPVECRSAGQRLDPGRHAPSCKGVKSDSLDIVRIFQTNNLMPCSGHL